VIIIFIHYFIIHGYLPLSTNQPKMRLAASVDSVGEQSVAVSVVKSTRGGKTGGGSVAVAQVVSALDLSEMGGLVESGGG
jgi:hypothetical protein